MDTRTVKIKQNILSENAREGEALRTRLAEELVLTAGMRRGEICGLRWSDLGECEVTVNRAISLDAGKAGLANGPIWSV